MLTDGNQPYKCSSENNSCHFKPIPMDIEEGSPDSSMLGAQQKRDLKFWLTRSTIIVVLLALIVCGYIEKDEVFSAIGSSVDWIEAHPITGSLLMIIILAFLIIIMLPGSVMAMI
mmetsp:Transcript_3247/g.4021  ORF Transcript_3247/g.4021 Transcript_3247/m.4021 type:complete len:115 (+) Transcript_3247:25-369(+)